MQVRQIVLPLQRSKVEGTEVPSFIFFMITAETIEKAVEGILAGTPHFLTEVEITPMGKICVYIDSFEKFTIDDCAKVNRLLRKEFGESLDDYDLTVSSAGMDRAFKSMKQYHKNLDREISVLTQTGNKIEGFLKRITENGIELQETPKPGKKGMPVKKGAASKIHEIPFSEIKETKRVIKI